MAGTEEKVAPETTTTNGHQAGQIPVENPRTGEIIAHVPDLTAEPVPRHGPARPRGAAGLGGARLRGPRPHPASACRSG